MAANNKRQLAPCIYTLVGTSFCLAHLVISYNAGLENMRKMVIR